jgi:DNA repair protein RecO (recombination protein O)
MPLYKEQGVVLRATKLAEADKIVTILTQGSGKVRAVAKGIRRTQSKFGARLEPFTHVSLMLYQGRNLDTVAQAEIVSPFRGVREDFASYSAGETMLETVDKVAEEHERNLPLFLLLLNGLRALDARPADPAAVAESFLLKLLSLSGFHPSLSACAVCGSPNVTQFNTPQGGAVCDACAEPEAVPVERGTLVWLDSIARADLNEAGSIDAPDLLRRQARVLLSAYTEYYLERRIRSLPLLPRGQVMPASAAPPAAEPEPEPLPLA